MKDACSGKWYTDGAQKELLINLCTLTAPNMARDTQDMMYAETDNYAQVSKTVKVIYFGHFLSTIPKCQGSP